MFVLLHVCHYHTFYAIKFELFYIIIELSLMELLFVSGTD